MSDYIKQNSKIMKSLDAAINRLAIETLLYHQEHGKEGMLWEYLIMEEAKMLPRPILNTQYLTCISLVDRKRNKPAELRFEFGDVFLFMEDLDTDQRMKAGILLNEKYL